MPGKALEDIGMLPPMLDLIPIEDAAVEFGTAQTSLYRYLKAGRLKRYKKALDRRTYIDRQELRRLVKPRVVTR